jgi:hypothetical protein
MQEILQDQSKFVVDKIQSDLTSKFDKSLRQLLQQLVKDKQISDDLPPSLVSSGPIIPRMYGLPKTHKDEVPLRPILSMVGSVVHKCAQWLVSILKPLEVTVCSYVVKDSFTFSSEVRDLDASNLLMASFDVTSLFTNVPLEESINFVVQCCERYSINLPISTTALKKLLLFCTQNVQFLFNGTFYRQIDGVAMGSPLGPLLANFFMSYIEEKAAPLIRKHAVHYTRYVDDTFILARSPDDILNLFNGMNSIHPNIRFTMENEHDNSLPFLDVLVSKSANQFITSVYRKKTWTGLYTNYHSCVPLQYKIGLIRTLLHRACKICSPSTLQAEISLIRKTLLDNGYPPEFLDRHLKFRPPTSELVYGPEKKRLIFRLPYVVEDIFKKLQNPSIISSLEPSPLLKCK